MPRDLPLFMRVMVGGASLGIPADERDEVIGDLLEQYSLERRSYAWLAREAVALRWGYRRRARLDRHPRGWRHHLDTAAQDVAQAIRALRRSPAFTFVSVLTLTLGIGLTTAMYSVIEAVLLAPLPYAGSDRIVRLAEVAPSATQAPAAPRGETPTVSDVLAGQLFARAGSFRALSAVTTLGTRVTVGTDVVYGRVAEVGGAFFEVFPASPVHGRLLTRSDAAGNADRVAVVSHDFWRSVLQTRADVVGMQIIAGDTRYGIVGVLPASFTFPDRDVQIWTAGSWQWPEPGTRRRLSMSLELVGRLADQATLEQAAAEGTAIALDVAKATPAYYDGTLSPSTVRIERLQDAIGARARTALLMLMAGVGCLLLIACVNLASLLLARATARQRELAVRTALGGSPLRVIRPSLVEHLLVTLAGGALGMLLAWALLRAAPALIPEDVPRIAEIGVRGPALALALGLCALIVVALGAVPMLQVPRRRLRDALGDGRAALAGRGTRSADHVRSALVVAQVAVSVVLLVGAGLLGRSLAQLLGVDTGYQTERVLTFQIQTPNEFYRDGARQLAFYESVLERVASHPSSRHVGYSTQLPLLGGRNWGSVSVVGDPRPATGEWPRTHYEVVSPGYFDAVGLPLLAGRHFTDDDSPGAHEVTIVSDEFVRRYLNGREPLGLQVQYGRRKPLTIVGVVRAKRNAHPSTPAEPEMFTPLSQAPAIFREGFTAGGFAVRTTGDAMALTPFVREQVRAIDPTLPVFNVMTLDDRLWRATAQPRFLAVTLGLFSLVAFVTAMVGIYGVLAYAVERRRTEFGIRRALGADESAILTLVLGRGIRLTSIGLAIGLAAGAAGARLLRALLFGIEPRDPATFTATAAGVLAVAAVACLLPARQAMRVQPVDALKLD